MYHVHRLEISISMLIFHIPIYTFNKIFLKITALFFIDIDNLILKFEWKGRVMPLRDLSIYSKVKQDNVVLRKEQTHRRVEQKRDQKQTPIDIYGQLISTKMQRQFYGQKRILQETIVELLDIHFHKECSSTCITQRTQKLTQNGSIQLNVRPETVKLLEESRKYLSPWIMKRFLRLNTKALP